MFSLPYDKLCPTNYGKELTLRCSFKILCYLKCEKDLLFWFIFLTLYTCSLSAQSVDMKSRWTHKWSQVSLSQREQNMTSFVSYIVTFKLFDDFNVMSSWPFFSHRWNVGSIHSALYSWETVKRPNKITLYYVFLKIVFGVLRYTVCVATNFYDFLLLL